MIHILHIAGTRIDINNSGSSIIGIPKCASTSIKEASRKYHCDHYEGHADGDEKCFAIIRDPFERWISGAYQYIYNYHRGNGPAVVLDKISKGTLVFDEHTLPMSYFLYPCYGQQIDYFTMGPNTISEINSAYRLSLENIVVNDDIEKGPMPNYLVRLTETHKFKKRFQQIYKDDITLFNDRKLTYSGPVFDRETMRYLDEEGYLIPGTAL